MIRTALISTVFLSAFALAQFAPSAANAAEFSKTLRCVVAQNCSVIPASCPGEFVAVNIRYENAERAKYEKERKNASCNKKVRAKNILNAECIQGQCALKDFK